jgi:uncharacterized protein YciI
MGYAILGWDGEDAEAPARRARARDRHLEVIARWAEAGRLSLAVPLFRADGRVAGSLMVLGAEDEVGTREYLLEEPFAREGVWLSYQMRPFRIAPLDYHPLPSGPMPSAMTHAVTIAEDAPGAATKRQAARPAHFARVASFAADGTLAMGGALLDAAGAMVGSIAVTRHASEAEARAFWGEDPYVTQGIWGETDVFLTRFAPLPYHPLPRA